MGDERIDGYLGRKGDGWEGRIEGLTQLDGTGVVDGHVWRFRSRWGLWQLLVAEPTDCDDAARVGHGVAGFGESAPWQPGMMMDPNTAWQIVGGLIAKFRAGELARIAADADVR